LAPVTQPARVTRPTAEPDKSAAQSAHKTNGPRPPALTKTASSRPDDGTNQLLKSGGWTLATGIFLAFITKFFLGGIGPQGPHTNSGWMALIVTMMCLPFGFLLFLLGALKWLRNRRGATNVSRSLDSTSQP
jgi:hypothetical protein